jgi:integrase
MNLTNSIVEKATLPAGKVQHFIRDEKLKGFGVRIGKSSKTFYFERKVNGRTVRTNLGHYPVMTTYEARIKAAELVSSMAHGVNPNTEKKKTDIKSRALEEYVEEYIQHKTLAKSTIMDMRGCFKRYLTDWLGQPLSSITALMIKERHQEISKRTEYKANRTFEYLSPIINYAINDAKLRDLHDLFPKGNPVKTWSNQKLKNKESPRRTIVPMKSIGDFLSILEHMISEERMGAYVLLFALFTGIRKEEAIEKLLWENVDLTDRTFFINKTKNHEPHMLPLTNLTFNMLQKLYLKNGKPKAGIVFKPDRGEKVSNLRYLYDDIEKKLGSRVTMHDLRRTFSTIAAKVLSYYEHKKVMNHLNSHDVTQRHYVVMEVEDLRVPLQNLEDKILSYK